MNDYTKMNLDELLKVATDLQESQQAMPDPGAVRQMKAIVTAAYALGLMHALENGPAGVRLHLTGSEGNERDSQAGA